MTKAELIERAKQQLNAGQPQPHVWPESEIALSACVMQTLSKVGHDVMRDDALRTLLQQVYSVPLDASGVGDPLTANGSITGVAGEILMDGIRYGAVVDANNNVLQDLAHFADFLRPQALPFAYYCLKDGKIHTRAINKAVEGPADIIGVSGPLSITANFSPVSVTHIRPELEDMTVHVLCGIVTVKIPAK